MEDARLTGVQLRDQVLPAIKADQAHLMIDACYAYNLAFTRGPGGGSRRPISDYTRLKSTLSDANIGLFLSTSEAREVYEWNGFQAGVFGHLLRSGLHGAADANNDGLVSYAEARAFVTHAAAQIKNDKFRPKIFVRPPRRESTLLDITVAQARNPELPAESHGRYRVEDQHGVRWADVNNSPHQVVHLSLPMGRGLLYLRRHPDGPEYPIPSSAVEQVRLAELTPAKLSTASTHQNRLKTIRHNFDHLIKFSSWRN